MKRHRRQRDETAPDLKHVRRVLVIKLRAIGDVLMSLPVVDNLRLALPEAAIDFLTEGEAYPIVRGYPGIHSVLVFDRKGLEGASPRVAGKAGLKLIQEVRSRNYDLVIDLFGNPRSALLAALSGARWRVGFNWRIRSWAYNLVVPSRASEVHEVEFNLDALRALGIPIVRRELRLWIPPEADRAAETFFQELGLREGEVIALNPGGGWEAKRWPPHRFAELAAWVVRELRRPVLVLWGPGEYPLAKQVCDDTENVFAIPETDLPGLAACLRRCEALVTNDSGPMHIAAALGVPVVAIFGPTRPDLQGPWGVPHRIVRNSSLDCLGCNLTRCSHPSCMAELPAGAVAEALADLLGELEGAHQAVREGLNVAR